MVVSCIVTIMLENKINSVTFSRSINKLIRDDQITFVNIPTVS